MNQTYVAQARLVLDLLTHVALEPVFALKGGSAINLFVRDMPRLSVDIDLVYVPVQPREESLAAIAAALDRLSDRVKRLMPDTTTQHKKSRNNQTTGLIVTSSGVVVK